MTEVHTWDTIHESTRRLIRTVDSLPDDAYAEPSALPGWSRGHVVAHLALVSEAFAAVMHKLLAGGDPSMYPSHKSRDADIEDLAGRGSADVRDRFLSGCALFQEAWEHMTDEAWGGSFRRAPGADPWPATVIPERRHIELEVHHADLAAGYSAAHWSEEFLDALFNRVVGERQDGPSLLLRTPDGDVLVGTGQGPVVTGSRVDLTWWLLGRGDGQGLVGDPALPTLGPWR